MRLFKKKIVKPTTIRLIRYEKNTWLKCHPDSNVEEWEAVQQPLGLSYYIIDNLVDLHDSGAVNMEYLNKVTVITLDDEYLEYLKEAKREDSCEARVAYPVDDEKADKLMKKNGLDKNYHLMILTLVCKTESDHPVFSMEQNTVENIREYLKNKYEKVWFPGYVMDATSLRENFRQLVDLGYEYIEHGQNILWGKYSQIQASTPEDGKPIVLFTPFVAVETIKHAKINIDELLSEGLCQLEKNLSRIEKMIKNDFEADDVFIPPRAMFVHR